jgi:hypothetical protein
VGADLLEVFTMGSLSRDADEAAKQNLKYDPDDDVASRRLWDGKPDEPLQQPAAAGSAGGAAPAADSAKRDEKAPEGKEPSLE